jgi:quinol monooxygenase YgiN
MALFVRAQFEVPAEKEQAFEKIAADLRDVARQEPGVLGYEWYSGQEPGVYLALEHFADSAAMVTHAELAHDLLNQLAHNSRMVSMELHGVVDVTLRAAVERMPRTLTIFEPALDA